MGTFFHSLQPVYGVDPKDGRSPYLLDTSSTDPRVPWLEGAYEEALYDNQQSEEVKEVSKYIQYIAGQQWPKGKPSYRSKPINNRVWRLFWEMVALLTDVRPTTSVKATDSQFDKDGKVINDTTRAWWLESDADLKLAMVIIWAILCTGHAKLCWNKSLRNGEGDFDIIPIGPTDLLYLKPDGFDLGNAQAVIWKSVRPLGWFRQKYGPIGSKVKADPQFSRYSIPARPPSNMSPFQFGQLSPQMQRVMGSPATYMASSYPQALHREFWLQDWTVHEGSDVVIMGDPRANWSYKVKPGEFLYPRGRLICMGGSDVLYDGPNPYSHGQHPFGTLRMNVVPWQIHGMSEMKPLVELQDIVNQILAGVMDMVKRAVNPGFVAPKNAFSDTQWQSLDWSMPGMKAAYNLAAGMQPQFAPQPQLPAFVLNMLGLVAREMDSSSGIATINEAIRKKQVPASDTLEQARQAQQTPIRLKGRNIEVFLRRFGRQNIHNVFQFYDAKRRIFLMGERGLTSADFDWDPGSMVPAGQSPMDHARKFLFTIEPGSLLNISKIEQASLLMNLRKSGDIDRETLFRQLDLGIDATEVTQNLSNERMQMLAQALKARQLAAAAGVDPGAAQGGMR